MPAPAAKPPALGLFKAFLVRKIADRFWRKIVLPIAQELQHHPDGNFTSFSLPQIIERNPVKGLIGSLLRPNSRQITNEDMAVALYLSMGGDTNPELFLKEEVSEAAALLVSELQEAIYRTGPILIYKAAFESLGKNRHTLSYDIDYRTVVSILADSSKLFTHHFNSFREEGCSDFINVWYPEDSPWQLDWQPDQPLTIHLDSSQIPEGFMLEGFKYSTKEGRFLEMPQS